MRRSARLFALAEHLRGRRTGTTAEQLAERFGVSVRTIYRDLDELRDASMPLVAERGRGGGFALDKSYSLPPVNFTAREAAILVTLARFVTEMRVLPFVRTLGTAVDKIRAALPTASQRDLDRLAQTLSFIGVPAHAIRPEIREAIEDAWFENRPLRVVYEGRDGRSTREVRIVSFVMERAETRLNCRDLGTDEARQYVLHRVAAATILPPS